MPIGIGRSSVVPCGSPNMSTPSTPDPLAKFGTQPYTDRDQAEDVADLLEEIARLRDDDRYKFAEDTLRGIHDTVVATQCATERQFTAVRNIERGGREAAEKRANGSGWTRRYEGY